MKRPALILATLTLWLIACADPNKKTDASTDDPFAKTDPAYEAPERSPSASGATMTPTNTYDRISFLRTRHSRRRLAQTANRVSPYAAANSSARLPTMSMASIAAGRSITAPSGHVIALMMPPRTSARRPAARGLRLGARRVVAAC